MGKYAVLLGLGVAGKPDSQDICLYQMVIMQVLLNGYGLIAVCPAKSSTSRATSGSASGRATLYDGQRRGLGIATAPAIVVAIDADAQRVVVPGGAGARSYSA